MEIRFAVREMDACARETRRAILRWGPEVGGKFPQRVVILAAAPDFAALYKLRFLRLHKLSGKYEGKYAITLRGRWRIVLSRLSDHDVVIEEAPRHYDD